MRIFIDCTDTFHSGRNTGIQRVVRNFVRHAMALGDETGVACQPVIFRKGYIFPVEKKEVLRVHKPRRSLRDRLDASYLASARLIAALLPYPPLQKFLLAHRSHFGLAWFLYAPIRLMSWLRGLFNRDDTVQSGLSSTLTEGDILFLPDASWSFDAFEHLQELRAHGVKIVFFIHDIIPLTHPDFFNSTHLSRFEKWFLSVVENFDYLFFNSLFTQQSVKDYVDQHIGPRNIDGSVIYLGFDLGPTPDHEMHHRQLSSALDRPDHSFLCVGTLEPRKNIGVVLDAFDEVWREKGDVSLVLIGRAGWLCEDLLSRMRSHSERGRKLFWFDDVNDADLALAYGRSGTLIFPSIVEGFGLPLVEALCQGLPVIASDIPVFREIAGSHIRYFDPMNAVSLANVLRSTPLNQRLEARDPFIWPTWEASTRQLIGIMRQLIKSDSGAQLIPGPPPVDRSLLGD